MPSTLQLLQDVSPFFIGKDWDLRDGGVLVVVPLFLKTCLMSPSTVPSYIGIISANISIPTD